MASPAEIVFLLADLAGYTALTEAHGGEEAANVVARYEKLAETALAPGTRLVERVGDQLLFVADTARSALNTALALRRFVGGEPLFPEVRAGIHRGAAIERGGRYFGPALNLAARVTAHARAGEILCTRPIAEAGVGVGIAARSLGEVRFKNVPEPVEVFEIVGSAPLPAGRLVDPVCRMQVDASTPFRVAVGGTTYLFCSTACATAFAAEPDKYPAGE
ncbi:MAG: YHS domain-containing protein [Candidatus Rokubacteria bacterium]|nr:YHS domain-containing protein [Candidatus Rokubacteria bacterium]